MLRYFRRTDIPERLPTRDHERFYKIPGAPELLTAARDGQVEDIQKRVEDSKSLYKYQESLAVCGVDDKGNTALHIAVEHNQVEAVVVLLGYGAPVRMRNIAGLTALAVAAQRNRVECLTTILNHSDEMQKSAAKEALDPETAGASAIEIAADNGNTECVLILLEHGFKSMPGVDIVGRSIAKAQRLKEESTIYPWSNTKDTINREELMNARVAAARIIQTWWKHCGNLEFQRRQKAALVIQRWYRNVHTNLWLVQTMRKHGVQASHSVESNADIDIANVFSSDENLDLAQEILSHFERSNLRSSPVNVATRTENHSSVSNESNLWPSYLSKTSEIPLLVRSSPNSKSTIVGIIGGGNTRILQTYFTNVTFTLVRHSKPNRYSCWATPRHDIVTEIWVRLANPKCLFGKGQAWCLRTVKRNEETDMEFLRQTTSFGRSLDGSSGIYNGGTDQYDPCCSKCVGDSSSGQEEHTMSSSNRSLTLREFIDSGSIVTTVDAGVSIFSCSCCGRVFKKPKQHESANDLRCEPSVVVENLAFNAYKGNAHRIVRMLATDTQGLNSLTERHFEVESHQQIHQFSVLQTAAFENNASILSMMISYAPAELRNAIILTSTPPPLLLACANGARDTTMMLLKYVTSIRDFNMRFGYKYSANGPPAGKLELNEQKIYQTAQHQLASVLKIAIYRGDLQLIEYLRALGYYPADLSFEDDENWISALECSFGTKAKAAIEDLFIASEFSSSSPLKLYIQSREHQFSITRSTIDLSIEGDSFSLASLLFGSSENSGTDCLDRSSTIVKLKEDLSVMVDAGCDVDIAGTTGTTYLMETLKSGRIDLAYCLLKLGASDTLPDRNGRNAWWYAARSGQIASLKMLHAYKTSQTAKALQNMCVCEIHQLINYEYGLNSWDDLSNDSVVQGKSPINAILECVSASSVSKAAVDSLLFLVDHGCRVPASEINATCEQMLLDKELVPVAPKLIRVEADQVLQLITPLVQQKRRLVNASSSIEDPHYQRFKTMLYRTKAVLKSIRRVVRDSSSYLMHKSDLEFLREFSVALPIKTAILIEFHRLDSGRQSRFSELCQELPWEESKVASEYFELLIGQSNNQCRANSEAVHDWGRMWLPKLIGTVNKSVLFGRWESVLHVAFEMRNKISKFKTLAAFLATVQEECPLRKEIVETITDRLCLKAVIEDQAASAEDLRRSARDLVGQISPEDAIKCGICLGPLLESEPCCKQTGGEHYKKVTCTHEYCKGCLDSWITSQLNESTFKVGCPHEKCAFHFDGDDILRISGDEAKKKFVEIGQRSFAARVAEFTDKDETMQKWIDSHTRMCPQCSVLIERSAGCNAMKCFTCGERFNWDQAMTMSVFMATRGSNIA